ncbi:1,4-dihydroxy-2-naphthoate polyprenyltransferase [Propionibacteriaceae bacterium Y1700]|uniref:1,4-dihydroxy-2-naphthoate polyprenyltransferase n=1 Tax=Microlunatus sp. Y1700 TaxID=3418487 RepID=UPI003DA6F6FE
MATAAEWIEGARPRTFPAAFSPVIAGSAIAQVESATSTRATGGFDPLLALLALVVSLALQIGVNYANDYSDGIRGTDDDRVGPFRLVGSGAARPGHVKVAAFLAFGVAAAAGVGIVLLTGLWWLLIIGVACILAACFYTGGEHPYGYAALGEVFVFVFFGLVAVGGTTLIQLGSLTWSTLTAAIAIGALACAILVANNLRDIHGDRAAGKYTLATRLGRKGTRAFFVQLCVLALLAVISTALLTSLWLLLGLIMLVHAAIAVRLIISGAVGKDLIRVLKVTGLAELACAIGLALGALITTFAG